VLINAATGNNQEIGGAGAGDFDIAALNAAKYHLFRYS